MIKQFELGGKLYTVEVVDNIDDTGLGRSYTSLNKITISNKFYGNVLPEDSKEQTFYHELVHCLLDELGYNKLSEDETFVQGFSTLLYQFEKTKK